jgi:hypothetical protein
MDVEALRLSLACARNAVNAAFSDIEHAYTDQGPVERVAFIRKHHEQTLASLHAATRHFVIARDMVLAGEEA